MALSHKDNSLETILTFETRNMSQWSAVWSTANITATGGPAGGAHRNQAGRFRLRLSALSMGALLSMHCKLTASALTGGFFIFVIFLAVSTLMLANPLRHFEVYLGQWSISGPGRAFRIIPMLDGIGIAMCINVLIRAIICCAMAAITTIYMIHSISDERLPYTYCRDFHLKPYEPKLVAVKKNRLYETNILNTIIFNDLRRYEMSQIPYNSHHTTVGLADLAWRNHTNKRQSAIKLTNRMMEFCNETYTGLYPALFSTPAYNFFYVEVVHLRSSYSFLSYNNTMIFYIIITWLIIWASLVKERVFNGRLSWNKMYRWLVIVPWIWGIVLLVAAIDHFSVMQYKLKYAFRVSAKEMIVAVADAMDVAIYIHASSLGTELIHGKGLNHYASGHIDPFLNKENVWHSVTLCMLAALYSGGASACAFVDYLQLELDQRVYEMRESSLWVLPMYSKCVAQGTYSHLKSCLVFGGLTFSYMTVAYQLMKTALHTIFEYKVTLVYVEQAVVAFLIIICMGSSLIFASHGGVVLLESVDVTMTALVTPIIAMLELIAMLYVYCNRDFKSDMNLSMEENACSSRMETQWQILPFITIMLLGVKIYTTVTSELPGKIIMMALFPVLIVVLAVPIRALHNIYVFLLPMRRVAPNNRTMS